MGEGSLLKAYPAFVKLAPLFLFLVALFLYAPPPSAAMWYDEVQSAIYATFPPAIRELFAFPPADPNPPLYYLFLRTWALALGFRDPGDETGPVAGVEAALRWPSAVFAALAVGALAAAFGPAPALLLLASPLWMGKAAEARAYALLGLLLLGAYWAMAAGRYRLSAFLGVLGLYTHYLAWFFLPWQAIYFLIRRRGADLWPYLLFLPWTPFFLSNLFMGGANAPYRPEAGLALDAFAHLGGYPLGLPLLGLVLYAAYLSRTQGGHVLLLLVPALTVMAWWAASLLVNVVSPRYFAAFLPLLAAGVGLALPRLPSPRPWVGILALASLPTIAALFFYPRELRVPDEGYNRTPKVAEAVLRVQGRAFVVGNEAGRLIAFRYYHRHPATEVREAASLEDQPPRWEGGYGLVLVFTSSDAVGKTRYLAELAELRAQGCRVALAADGDPVLLFAVRCPQKTRGEGIP